MNSRTAAAPAHVAEPHDLDAERALLGSLLIERQAILAIAPIVKPDDFYDPKHRLIYAAILRLYQDRKPADLVLIHKELLTNLHDDLKAAELIEDVGGMSYVAGLLNAEITAVHAKYYAQIVLEMAIRRRHIGMGGDVAKLAYDTSTPIGEMLSAVAELSGTSELLPEDPYISSNDAVTALMDRISLPVPPRVVKTGYADLDAGLRGFLDGWLVIVGARPGHGKTSFGVGCLYEHCVRRGRPGALISLEMPYETIMQRMLAVASRSDTSGLLFEHQTFEREERLSTAAGQLSNSGLVMIRNPSSEWATVAAQIRELVAIKGVELVVIDYVGLMHNAAAAKSGRVQEISSITRGLKLLAMNLNIPIIGLQQLSRKVDERGTDAKPRLSDLRESGSFEQDADVVIFVSHDDPEPNRDIADAEFHVAKNRHGRTSHLAMQWHAPTAEFRDAYRPKGGR